MNTRRVLGCSFIALLAVAAALLGGCGGSKATSAPPAGTGTVRGVVSLPTGSATDAVLVRVEGTSLQARPGPGGVFEIRGVPAGPQTISAVSPVTNLGAHATVTVSAGGEAQLAALQLLPGGQIAGIVTAVGADGSLQARAGATVTVRPAGVMTMFQENVPIAPDDTPPPPPIDPAITLTATSAADGSYVLKGVPQGAYLAVAALPGFAAQERFIAVEVGHTATGDFVFGQPSEPQYGQVTGKVLGKDPVGSAAAVWGAQVGSDLAVGGSGGSVGGGVVGLPVSVTGSSTGSMPMPPYYEGSVAFTDENGNYTLRLPEGRHTIQCRQRDYQTASAVVEVKSGQTVTLDFTLEPVPGERPKLELSASVLKESYSLGEPVELRLLLKNTGAVPVTLSFGGREAQFTVWSGEALVWAYGEMVPIGPGPLPAMRGRDILDAVLRPGETREYRVAWNQRGFDGTLVAPGAFSLRGAVNAGEISIQADPIAFRITAL